MNIEYKERTLPYFRDYSEVLVKEDVMNLTKEDLEHIKKEAQPYLKRSLQKSLNCSYMFDSKSKTHYSLAAPIKKPEDVKFKRRAIDEDKTILTLVQANVCCNNPEMLIDILLNKKISYNTIALISRDIDNLKLLSTLKIKLEELLKKDVSEKDLKLLKISIRRLAEENEKLNNKINEIVKIFEQYYAVSDINIIIARLLQITVFEREIYKEKEKILCK